MNPDRDALYSCWREVERTPPGDREWRAISLGLAAPVALLAGVREPDGRIALLVEAPIGTPAAPLFRMQADGVSVVDQRDSANGRGLRRLAVVLERPELREVFVTLVLDLVDVAQAATSTDAACRNVTSRLAAWQACLNGRRRGLSDAEQIGLMGEFEVLRLAAALIGFGAAIASWKGPLNGLHDFVGPGASIEVKSALGPANLIRISDSAQLDTRGLSRLALARPRFRSDPDGTDLAARFRTLRDAILFESPGDLQGFEEKVLRAGFIAAEFHTELTMTLEDICWYDVKQGFPYIDPAAVPPAVTSVTYMLDERSLRPFAMGQDDSDGILRQLGSGAK